MILKIKKLHVDAKMPSYAHHDDAGFDLFSLENCKVKVGERVAVPTGIAMEIPEGFVGLIWDKSGLAVAAPVTVDWSASRTAAIGFFKLCRAENRNQLRALSACRIGGWIAGLAIRELTDANPSPRADCFLALVPGVRRDMQFRSPVSGISTTASRRRLSNLA